VTSLECVEGQNGMGQNPIQFFFLGATARMTASENRSAEYFCSGVF
jgi:hypothetical protein